MEFTQFQAIGYPWLIDHALRLGIAILVLIAGLFLAGFLSRQAAGLLPRSQRVDATITPLLSQLVRYSVLVVTFIIVLGQLGVQTASILAVLGAAGLAIALALQNTLTNIASGVMLIWLRPFGAGDHIDAEGTTGTVVEIGLFGTQLRTAQGVYVFAPNSRLWNARIVNYSREKSRRLDLDLSLAPDTDLEKARAALLEIAKADGALGHPAALVLVTGFDASALKLKLRLWFKTAGFETAKAHLLEKTRQTLADAGIEVKALTAG